MIKVNISEPATSEWKAWRKKAEDARKEAEKEYAEWVKEGRSLAEKDDIEAWQKHKPGVNENLYKEMRDWYMEQFNFKCAYCEMPLQVGQVGDVEHYRPKGRIQGDDGKSLKMKDKDVPRPGYYWLAYEWTNLMPSCSYCNRPSHAIGATESFGKRDLFPLADEAKRASKPGDEQKEEPLLLNPYVDKPDDHLVFDEIGSVAPRHDKNAPDKVSAKGRNSIAIFGLERPRLVDERKKAYFAAWKSFKELVDALGERQFPNHALIANKKGEIESIKKGKVPYSAVCRTAIREYREMMRNQAFD